MDCQTVQRYPLNVKPFHALPTPYSCTNVPWVGRGKISSSATRAMPYYRVERKIWLLYFNCWTLPSAAVNMQIHSSSKPSYFKLNSRTRKWEGNRFIGLWKVNYWIASEKALWFSLYSKNAKQSAHSYNPCRQGQWHFHAFKNNHASSRLAVLYGHKNEGSHHSKWHAAVRGMQRTLSQPYSTAPGVSTPTQFHYV